MFNDPEEMLRYLDDERIQFVDLRFSDLLGAMQHFNVPLGSFDESVFSVGVPFDGSSIRGFQQIHESDMVLYPDVSSAFVDPFRTAKTLAVNCFVHDPVTHEPYSRDPRNVARKAESHLITTGIADAAFFGPEAEFYIFDSIRFASATNEAYHHIDSIEGWWNSGREESGGNLGYKTAYKSGYLPAPPVDHFSDLRAAMVAHLVDAGFTVEKAHHEVGTAGQAEIDFKYAPLLHCADNLQLYKYIVKNTAWAAGHTATFMPKPLFGDNGSGMHTHQSLWLNGRPLFYDESGYAGLSNTARWYIGGLLRHAPSLCAFTNPTVNSYRRLVPGFEAPVNLVYSQRNRSACARIPVTGDNPSAKRVEFRVPDPAANPYLAFSAMLMAGLDGIKSKSEPPPPIDKDLYDLPPDEFAGVEQTPGSLPEVLDALDADHDYLLDGGVFTGDLIETWVALKRTDEIDPVLLRPTAHEFAMYYDV